MRIRHFVCIGAIVILSACGGGSGGGESDEPAAKKTSAKSSVPPLSEAQAKKALLTVADFSDGWKVDPDDDSDADIKMTKGAEACKKLAEDEDDEAPTDVTSSFSRGDEASVSSSIESYDSSDAKKRWDADLKIIKACHGFTMGDSDGFELALKVEPTQMADLGDDSAAFHATGTVEGFTVHLEALGVRVGRNVVGITAMSFGDRAPLEELEQMMETVLDRLDKIDDAA